MKHAFIRFSAAILSFGMLLPAPSSGNIVQAESSVNPLSMATGDVNADDDFDVSDVILLQKWLLAVPDTQLSDWKAADFCNDEVCLKWNP